MRPAMLNKEHTQSSKPNEEFDQHLHRPELLIAAALGDSEGIERLLLHREDEEETITGIKHTFVADITGAGDTVLHVAASSGDGDQFLNCAMLIVDKANHLLVARNWKGDTPLHCAARLRNARMVSHLLALARGWDGDEMVKVILRVQNNKQETVLHEAIRLEDMEIILELVSLDPELARFPLTDAASPLYLALSLGHWDIAWRLFHIDEKLSYSGPDGKNAFHAAILGRLGKDIISFVSKWTSIPHSAKTADAKAEDDDVDPFTVVLFCAPKILVDQGSCERSNAGLFAFPMFNGDVYAPSIPIWKDYSKFEPNFFD